GTSPCGVPAVTVLEWPPNRSAFSYSVTLCLWASSQAQDRAATPEPTTATFRVDLDGAAKDDDMGAPAKPAIECDAGPADTSGAVGRMTIDPDFCTKRIRLHACRGSVFRIP